MTACVRGGLEVRAAIRVPLSEKVGYPHSNSSDRHEAEDACAAWGVAGGSRSAPMG